MGGIPGCSPKRELPNSSDVLDFYVSAFNVERWHVEGAEITGERLGEARYI